MSLESSAVAPVSSASSPVPPASSRLQDSLLAKLVEGDLECAEKLFHEYEPYLRFIIRKQLSPRLRAKFDSTDVLQSVWECVVRDLQVHGLSFDNSDHLRTFLVKITHHRFFDQIRQHRGALDNEIHQSEDRSAFRSNQPRPSEEVQADDAWHQLLAMCPPAHHDVLRLKRSGLSLTEIAEETGLHLDSIRRILRNLARRYSKMP